MVGRRRLKLFTAVLASLIRVVLQRVRFAAAPNRHHQRFRDRLGCHRGAHRPADNTAREQVDDGRHVEPAFCRPEVSKISDPLLVRRRGRELPIQHVVRRLMPGALVRRQAPAAWPSPQGLITHQPLDTVQSACGSLGQHVVPNPPGAIGPVTADEAGLDLGTENLVAARPGTGRAGEPGMEATARDIERLAKPPHRPDPSMLRNKRTSHRIPSEVGRGFFRQLYTCATWCWADCHRKNNTTRLFCGSGTSMTVGTEGWNGP